MLGDTKKVIIYGVGGAGREKVEQFLSDKYEIVGYSDSSDLYADTKWYEYKKFYQPQELAKAEADYIIVAVKSYSMSQSVCDDLMKLGIKRNKIVLAADLFLTVCDFDSPVMDYLKLSTDFEGVCMGMSYSRKALFTHLLKRKFFKLSYYGMDIHYYYKSLEWILKSSPQHLKSLKYILIDMPYYILNWDMSDKDYFLPQRIPRLNCYDDYHNIEFTEKNTILFKEHEIMKDMFYEKSRKNYSCVSNNYEGKKAIWGRNENNTQWLESLYKIVKQERITENAELLEKMLQMIFSANANVKVAIVVFPFLCEEVKAIKNEIKNMKEIFYEEIEKLQQNYSLQIFDFNDDDFFQDKSFYSDETHLNREGGILFTKKLEEMLENNFYKGSGDS